MRVLIADDEAPARARLRQLLVAHADCQILAEVATGLEVRRALGGAKFDLLLLDIEMPGIDGVNLVAKLPPARPAIIFCTAYDQYAVDAFELGATDYLLKPISRARLAQALERVRAARGGAAGFLVKVGARHVPVAESEVLYFSAAQGLTRMMTAEKEYWMDESLAELEQRSGFFRISRETLVALRAVAEVTASEVRLRNGQHLAVSRRRHRELLLALGS